jgi:hypothetical protein
MKRSLLTLVFAAAIFLDAPLASEKPRNNYIDKYKDIALAEKRRSGIPVAIILGQGIFESGWGEAQLATGANNHFGIKCGSAWTGPTFAQKDDDRDSCGNIIQSCFRLYESVEGSYVDHTNFLMNGKRYSSLFNIPQDNYREWAFGLQSAGYATDPQYAEKLISIIERFQLYRFDGLGEPIVAQNNFMENKFEKTVTSSKAYVPLNEVEIFEISAGTVIQESPFNVPVNSIPALKETNDESKQNIKKKFEGFFKKPKVGSGEATENLDDIQPSSGQPKTVTSGVKK